MNIKVERGVKNKKKTFESGREIDNTASVRQIVNGLTIQNPAAAGFYSYNVRPKTEGSKQFFHDYVLPGHPLNSFPDDWNDCISSQHFGKFFYRSMRPKMITPPIHIDKEDPVTEYMNKKRQYNVTGVSYKKFLARHGLVNKFKKINDEVVYCPKILLDVAAHLESDPLPYFDSSYNWNYAGNGNMQMVSIDWIDYLLHSEFSSVSLTRFHNSDLTLEFKDSVNFNCGKDKDILETICLHNSIVVLRTMYKIFILKMVKRNDIISFEQIKTIDSEMPFTGINFDAHHRNILYVVTLDAQLTIVNLDRMTGRRVTCQSTSLVNNWNTVVGSERSYYTHVSSGSNGGCLTIFDKRTNAVAERFQNVTKISDQSCNTISAANQKENSPLMLFATNHHLFMIDLRYKPTAPRAVQRWTHGMHCVPTYITRCNFEFGKDLICLSSQWCEDMCVVPCYVERSEKAMEMSVTMPYRPPSILETLKLARENLLCCDVYNRVDKRLSTTITGVSLIEQSDKYAILMHNAFGDISCHVLYPEHLKDVVVDDSFKQLEEWAQFKKSDEEKFVVSEVKNIKTLLESLKEVSNDFNPQFGLSDEDATNFDEAEILKTFEENILDAGLLEAWTCDNDKSEAGDVHDEINEDGDTDKDNNNDDSE